MAFNPEIPVIRPPIHGDLHIPTTGDLEGGILESITLRGNELLRVDNHAAVQLSSLRPHHPDGSDVLWIVERSGETITSWDDQAWQRLAQNSQFLTSIEKLVSKIRESDPKKHVYFFMGFVSSDQHFDGIPVYPRGLQSQKRAHMHITDPITIKTPYERLLDVSHGSDARQMAIALNNAAEFSIQYFQSRMTDYGEKFTFHHPLGINEKTPNDHTMFGFHSLQEALVKSLALIDAVLPDWISHAEKLVQAQLPQPVDGVTLRYKQTAVPSIDFIFPSAENRRLGQVENDYPVWTMPFSVINAQYVLTEGGVVFDHSASVSQGNPSRPK